MVPKRNPILAHGMLFIRVGKEVAVEPSLMVIGVNHRTAPVATRERFWISEKRRYEALAELAQAEGIEEVMVLSTCARTEFLLWSTDVTLAANSVMRLLSAQCGLKLSEWENFYRHLDDAALLHIFRLAAGLDSVVSGDTQIVSQLKESWRQAQKMNTAGRYLDAVIQKAMRVSERIRCDSKIDFPQFSIADAAVKVARQVFGSLQEKKLLLIGAGRISELCAKSLLDQGARSIGVISRTIEHAGELAEKLGSRGIPLEDRWQHMAQADVIVSSTSCPHTVLSRAEAESMVQGREAPLVIVDVAMPRDIDPDVRKVPGVRLYDLDDVKGVIDENSFGREMAEVEAEKILHAEAREFRRSLAAQRVIPTIVALRQRLDEICRQELDSYRAENGPFTQDQNEMLNAIMVRMTQRITGSLARELKELPEQMDQDQMTFAVQRLFHLHAPEMAIAGTTS